jgi:hypothetical protein
MSEQITLEAPQPGWESPPPLPGWLSRRFLEPEEQVLWWQGPPEREGPGRFLDDDLLLIARIGAVVFLVAALSLGSFGVFVGGLLGTLVLVVGLRMIEGDEQRIWNVLTDRRLFTITGRSKTQEYTLAQLLLLAEGNRPDGSRGWPEDRVHDLGQVGPSGAGAKGEGITNLESILAMARMMAQIRKPDGEG